jgi:hypothetical protein
MILISYTFPTTSFNSVWSNTKLNLSHYSHSFERTLLQDVQPIVQRLQSVYEGQWYVLLLWLKHIFNIRTHVLLFCHCLQKKFSILLLTLLLSHLGFIFALLIYAFILIRLLPFQVDVVVVVHPSQYFLETDPIRLCRFSLLQSRGVSALT